MATEENQLARRKAPAKEVYGFVLYLTTIVLCALYLVWLLTPNTLVADLAWLELLPRKYWALALPAALGATLVGLFVLFVGINLLRTPAPSDWITVRDAASRAYKPVASATATPDLADMTLEVVNDMLYSRDGESIAKNPYY